MSLDVALAVAWGAVAGLVLGLVFFLGLWATVQRIARGSLSRVWLGVSFLLRLVVVGAGLLLVARAGIWPLAGALAGFLVARPLVTRLVVRRSKPVDLGGEEPAA